MPGSAAIASLTDLIAPMPVERFRALLAERRPHHVPGAGGDRFAALLDWDGLIERIGADDAPLDNIRLYRDRAGLPRLFLREAGAERRAMVDRLLAADASIMLNHADRHVAALGSLCAAVAEEIGDNVSAVAIATAGAGGALPLHYDPYDLVVLQVDGAKRWVLHGDPVANPVYGMPRPPAGDDSAPVMDVELRPGDWLFVPAGYRHRCDTSAARSLHISILIYPLTAARAVELLLRAMLASPDDRAPLRFGPDEAAATEAALKRQLLARVAALSIDDLARLHRATSAQRDGEP